MTDHRDWLPDMKQRLTRRGFNLVGVCDVAAFDSSAPEGARLGESMPGARSAVVIGAGGRELWSEITGPGRRRSSEGGGRTADPDPIDRFTTLMISAETDRFHLTFPGAALRVLYPFGDATVPVSFLRLAEAAGFGTGDTVLRLLIHPVYGPWVSLRACLLTDRVLRPDRRLDDFRPCDRCPRSCLDVCPVGAISLSGWDHAACFDHRRSGSHCIDGCAPRLACPVGAEHRFGTDEMKHRQIAALD